MRKLNMLFKPRPKARSRQRLRSGEKLARKNWRPLLAMEVAPRVPISPEPNKRGAKGEME